jgi:subtilisin-like proprotein convertase family protein
MFRIPFSPGKSLLDRADSRRKARKTNHARRRCRPLRCEPLEDRRLLSVYANTTALAIPDVGKVTSQINVPDSFIVADLNLKLTIQHTRDRDLHAFLITPNNTRVELFSDVGGARGQNFTNTILDDEATKSITLGTAPFTGTFRPEGDLSAVEGKQTQGTWKLEITDDTKKSTGTLKSWSIDVEPPAVPTTNFIDTNPAMLGNAGLGAAPNNFFTRKIVAADNGDAMAVWLESRGAGDTGPWSTMAARYDAQSRSWQTPVVILEGSTSNAYETVDLAGDGQGNYLAAMWENPMGADDYVWAKRFLAVSGWQPAELLGDQGGAPRVTMAYDPLAGVTRAVVVWLEPGPNNVVINRLDDFASGSWAGKELAENSPPDPGINTNSIDAAMAGNGDFMLVFSETGVVDPINAYYRVYRYGTGWTAPETLLENRPEVALDPDVVMNSTGVAMVSWNQRTGVNNTSQLWARRWNGSGWDSEGELVNDHPANAASIRPGGLAIDEQGEAVVLYRQWDGTAYYDAYVRRHDGTRWATNADGSPDIIQLDTTDGDVGAGSPSGYNASNRQIAMDDAGNAAAVWTQDDGFHINLWASQFSEATSTWSTAKKLEDAHPDAVCPAIDMTSGVAQVIWSQSDGVLNHIYTTTLTQPANAPSGEQPLVAALGSQALAAAFASQGSLLVMSSAEGTSLPESRADAPAARLPSDCAPLWSLNDTPAKGAPALLRVSSVDEALGQDDLLDDLLGIGDEL